MPAGAAAIAAGEQGRGWNFVELFYRNQGTEASGYVTDAFLTEVAKGAGVPDIAKWNSDRKSKRRSARSRARPSRPRELGLTGTPSFAVAGPERDQAARHAGLGQRDRSGDRVRLRRTSGSPGRLSGPGARPLLDELT